MRENNFKFPKPSTTRAGKHAHYVVLTLETNKKCFRVGRDSMFLKRSARITSVYNSIINPFQIKDKISQFLSLHSFEHNVVQVDHKRGLVIETMSAPNPFCPHTRGMCWLMLLLNLGLILVTLGIVIVVQFFQPVFVW